MEVIGARFIEVTGETGLYCICKIDLLDEFCLISGEVILRACSALLPEIDFDPNVLVLKDENGWAIDSTQYVYSGERVTLHSTKGDPLQYNDRCGVLVPEGWIEVVPYNVHKKIAIHEHFSKVLSDPFELWLMSPGLLRIEKGIFQSFVSWCFFVDDPAHFSARVNVHDRDTMATMVVQRALAKLNLNPENYILLGDDFEVSPYDVIKIKRTNV